MNKIPLDQLKEYLKNTPEKILEKEHKDLAYLNKIGPDVSEYLDSIRPFLLE